MNTNKTTKSKVKYTEYKITLPDKYEFFVAINQAIKQESLTRNLHFGKPTKIYADGFGIGEWDYEPRGDQEKNPEIPQAVTVCLRFKQTECKAHQEKAQNILDKLGGNYEEIKPEANVRGKEIRKNTLKKSVETESNRINTFKKNITSKESVLMIGPPVYNNLPAKIYS